MLGDFSVLGHIVRPDPDGLPAAVHGVPDGLVQGVRGHGHQQVHRAVADVVRGGEAADEQTGRRGHGEVQPPTSLLLSVLHQRQTHHQEENQDIQVPLRSDDSHPNPDAVHSIGKDFNIHLLGSKNSSENH